MACYLPNVVLNLREFGVYTSKREQLSCVLYNLGGVMVSSASEEQES